MANTGYMVAIIVLVVIAGFLGAMWYMTNQNYNTLHTQYANLQNQYNTLETNYTTLKSNYNSLQSQYQALQSQYSSLQSQYSGLQSQYSALQSQYGQLQSQYSKLNGTYWNILTFLGQDSGSGTLQPGYFTRTWVVVPSGFSGTIHITVSASSSVEVFVFDLYNLIQFAEGYSYTYYLYDYGTYINDQVSVGPGLYIIVIYNPSSTTAASYSFAVTTTYTPTSS
jgi:FtsZ-binding cell division protein ZapB